jgi:hypothetical protein
LDANFTTDIPPAKGNVLLNHYKSAFGKVKVFLINPQMIEIFSAKCYNLKYQQAGKSTRKRILSSGYPLFACHWESSQWA